MKPCREFCNARGCEPDACRNPYSRDDPRHWLGRGSQDVPGKPFGWARMMQDIALCDWQRARGINPSSFSAYFQRQRMHTRLERDYHRRKPPIGVRRVTVSAPAPSFTREQLEHIAETWASANDPVSAACAAVALALLAEQQSESPSATIGRGCNVTQQIEQSGAQFDQQGRNNPVQEGSDVG